MTIEITRRTLIAAGAAGAGATVLAACGSSGGSDAHHSAADSPTSSGPTSEANTSAATSAAPTTAASSSSSAATVSGLVALSKVPVGGAVSVTLADGKPGIVAQPTSGKAVAFSAICTHQGCTVKPNGAKLDCPCHGSVFNALTGAVEQGPAQTALPSVSVKVEDGQVVAS